MEIFHKTFQLSKSTKFYIFNTAKSYYSFTFLKQVSSQLFFLQNGQYRKMCFQVSLSEPQKVQKKKIVYVPDNTIETMES